MVENKTYKLIITGDKFDRLDALKKIINTENVNLVIEEQDIEEIKEVLRF